MATEKELNEAFDAGVASAKALLAETRKPLLMADEFCGDELSTANAKGWNSVCASDENVGRSFIAETAAAVGRPKFSWKREWAEKVQIERPRDRLPRGMKQVPITKPYGLMLDEMPHYY